MPDYSKTIIYKLCCKDATITNIYIGSTCNFSRRKTQHKHSCNNTNNNRYNNYKYQFIRDNGGFENWNMIQIKEFSCNNKKEKDTEERKHIEELKPSLNKYVPCRTNKEYQKDNKERLKEYKKDYNIKHKEKVKTQMNEYRLNNKAKMNEYRLTNKEKIKEQQKIYAKSWYLKNKEKVKAKARDQHLKKKEEKSK